MGMLVKGLWHQDNPPNQAGAFKRPSSSFRNWPVLHTLKEKPSRYCLFVAKACPWAHRTLIFLKLKGLEDAIDVFYVKPHMAEHGWELEEAYKPINAKYLHELYTKSNPEYSGKVTVPVLWDTEDQVIINNESADIIEMLNDDWNFIAKHPDLDLMPEHLRQEREDLNAWVYEHINNAVYRTGFASNQAVYEKECRALFAALDQLEHQLSRQSYLFGDEICDTDVRLFTTLVRFDAVYVGHFKCNLKMIREYSNLHAYMLRVYKRVKDTVDIHSIKAHYYQSHPWINPNGIVALGVDEVFTEVK
jgi:putative glutathione S-transferase